MRILELLETGQLEVLRQDGTTYICRCPVCGSNNLKIRGEDAYNAAGAYTCWSCRDSQGIRETLGLNQSSFGPRSPFWPDSKVRKRTLSFRQLTPYSGTSLVRLPFYMPVEPKGSTTIYPYGDNQRLVRKDVGGQKYFSFEHLEDGRWIRGSDRLPPLYSRGLPVKSDTGDTVLWVEGEKTAEFVKAQGFAAITSATLTYNPERLPTAILIFKKQFPYITNCIIIPDCDPPGWSKANLTQEALGERGIGSKILDPNSLLFTNYTSGEDLCDFPELLNIIKEYV